MRNNVVVTGGAGFMGSHLVEMLIADSQRVVVIDDFSTGSKANLGRHPKLTVINASILGSINGYFKKANIAFHLAAVTRPRWSIEHPKKTAKVNIEGTINVLQACLNNNVGKLVFVSSASVYGKQNRLTLSEDMCPRPANPYALTKYVGEQYCKMYADLYGLKYDIVRPFNVYGERQSLQGGYSAAVSIFINKLRDDKAPQISGDGKQVRDFVYVKDVAKLLTLIAGRKGSGEIFNAGSGKTTSVNDLYKTICKLMNKYKKPGFREPTPNSVETKADISKAKKLLGWEPETGLEKGLKKTIWEKI